MPYRLAELRPGGDVSFNNSFAGTRDINIVWSSGGSAIQDRYLTLTWAYTAP